MNRLAAVILSFAMCSAPAFAAPPELSGTWRSDAPVPRALVVQKSAGGYRGLFHVLQNDRAGTPFGASLAADGAVKFSLDQRYGEFDGKFAPDGKSFSGSWTNSAGTAPITFTRAEQGWKFDPAPHRSLRVKVEKDVSLEVLDFGGTGTPLIFIPGSGATAHVFDVLAPKFTAKHRVYAITRRGWGESDLPSPTEENYSADRMGDDVLAVMTALDIRKPVLAGHSFAGQEMSSIGTRHPDLVAGLVYLDAGYGYAFYDAALDSSAGVEANMLRRMLAGFVNLQPSKLPAAIREIRESMARLSKQLDWYGDYARVGQDETNPVMLEQPSIKVGQAMELGMRAYTGVKPPILAIYASPQACRPSCDDPSRLWQIKWAAAQADAVEKSYPKARVVRIPLAQHYVFRSHEAEVLKEMNTFMEGLKP